MSLKSTKHSPHRASLFSAIVTPNANTVLKKETVRHTEHTVQPYTESDHWFLWLNIVYVDWLSAALQGLSQFYQEIPGLDSWAFNIQSMCSTVAFYGPSLRHDGPVLKICDFYSEPKPSRIEKKALWCVLLHLRLGLWWCGKAFLVVAPVHGTSCHLRFISHPLADVSMKTDVAFSIAISWVFVINMNPS